MLLSLVRRSLKSDLRCVSLRILLSALIIAVAAVSAVGFFTDRVSRAMQQQAGDLLAADVRIEASRAIAPSLQAKADALGLQSAAVISFPSVVLNADDESALVSVKAVSDNYPLRGALSLADVAATEDVTRRVPPAPGDIAVAPTLVHPLQLQAGDTLWVGNSELRVTATVAQEPDAGGGLFQMAPRLLMRVDDLATAGLLVEGSRARYALLLAGPPTALSAFQAWYDSEERLGLEWRDADNARPQIQRVLDQIQRFFGLAAMLAVLLSGAAIAMAVRQYAREQASAGAILRTLGASRKTVMAWMLVRLALLAGTALGLGLLLGLLAQTVLAGLLGAWFDLSLPAAGWAPFWSAAVVTVLTLIGFAALPLLRAGAAPVVGVLRQEYGDLGVSGRLTLAVALVAAALMMYLQAHSFLLVALVLAGLLAILLVFALAGGVLYRGMRWLTPRSWPVTRLVLRRRMDVTLLQLSTFGFAIMTMLLIGVVRGDILRAWEQDIPADAPDHFIVNIQPAQVDGVLDLLRERLNFEGALYPVSRGRLLAVNDEDAESRYAGDERARGMLDHEFNLSYADEPPRHNTVTRGEWWAPDEDVMAISAESGFAERLGLDLGDTVTFQVAGVQRGAVIANIREVEWESFQVNFFAITSSAMLSDLPATSITSYHQGADTALRSDLVRAFPGITVIDVGPMLERVRGIVARGALAVQSVFLFTLLAGIILLLSAVQSSRATRMRELALLRSLGASHRQVRQSVVLEFTLLGASAGLLAALFASVIAWLIGTQVLSISIATNPMLWIYGTFGGAVIIGVSGYLANRQVLHIPPLAALRAAV